MIWSPSECQILISRENNICDVLGTPFITYTFLFTSFLETRLLILSNLVQWIYWSTYGTQIGRTLIWYLSWFCDVTGCMWPFHTVSLVCWIADNRSVSHEKLILMTLTLPGKTALYLTYINRGQGPHRYRIHQPFKLQLEHDQDFHSSVLTAVICIQIILHYSSNF